MRLIGGLLLMLLGLGWLASEVPLAKSHPAREPEADWRRTADGWEHASQWAPRPKIRPPAVHPLVIGLLQILLTSAAFVAFSQPQLDGWPSGDRPTDGQ